MYYNIQYKVHNVILRNDDINCVFHFEKLSLKVIADPPFYSLVIKCDNNDIKSCFVFKRGGAKSAGRETAAMALMVHRTPWGYNDTMIHSTFGKSLLKMVNTTLHLMRVQLQWHTRSSKVLKLHKVKTTHRTPWVYNDTQLLVMFCKSLFFRRFSFAQL